MQQQLLHLAYCPNQTGYTVERGSALSEQMLEGGPPRYRKEINGAGSIVSVSWAVRQHGHAYLNTFYDVWSDNPKQPFTAYLQLNSGKMEKYECYFSGGKPPRLDRRDGAIYIVSAQFFVIPLPRDKDWETMVLAAGTADPHKLTNLLNKLVNEVMPKEFGNG